MYESVLLPVADMNKNTRTLTLSALLSALTVVVLYIASLWPTGRESIVALASIFTAAAVIEMGKRQGIYVYVVASVLGMLILPNRAPMFSYMFFFGYYPVVKSLIEQRVHVTAVQWILKICICNAAVLAIWFFVREIMFGDEPPLGLPLLLAATSVLVIVFDYGFTKVIWLYINRISKYIKKGNN